MKSAHWIAAFLAGAATMFVILVASLKFYVGNDQPHLTLVASFVVFEIAIMLLRRVRGKKLSMSARIPAFVLEAATFAVGAFLMMRFLLSIYPPNFS